MSLHPTIPPLTGRKKSPHHPRQTIPPLTGRKKSPHHPRHHPPPPLLSLKRPLNQPQVGMEFEFRPNPPRVGKHDKLCKVVDCPRQAQGGKDGMCKVHDNLSNDKEFYSGTRPKNIRLNTGLRSMLGIASHACRFNNWEDLATKDPSRAAVQYVLNTDLHAANIDASNRTHVPVTAWIVFSPGQEPTNGCVNNPRGFQKVVGV